MTPLRVILLFTVITLLNSACTKTSLIGEDIFASDTLGLKSTDTISMLTTTVVGETARTYSPTTTQQLPNYLVGQLADPMFGNSTAIAYAQLRLLITAPNFESTTLDSVVLSLPYDVNERHYGNTDGEQTITVSRLTESMDAEEEIQSTKRFDAGQILGQKTFVPNLTDSINILVPSGDTILEERVRPQLRIPLSSAFGNELLNSADQMGGIDDFLSYFKGIEIKGSGNTDAMLSFALSASSMTLYYTQEDSIFDENGDFDRIENVAKRYVFAINSFSAKSVYYFNDRTGIGQDRVDAPITQYMNNTTDSLLFVQSTQGTMAKVTFPYLDDLAGAIVNKAELIVTVANQDNLTDFGLPEQLILTSLIDSNYVVIEDIAVSLNRSGGFELFGGEKETESVNNESVTTYTMNITGHFQDVIDGIVGNDLFIVTYPKPQIANRVILGGAGHSTYPIKLRLNYTKLD